MTTMQTEQKAENAPALQRAKGHGRIRTQIHRGQTRVDELYQEGCAKIRLPHTHDDTMQAVLINTAGGLTGGDHMKWEIEASENAHVVATTPACERIYKSTSGAAEIDIHLTLGPDARLDWLPQETILFEHANLTRRMEVDLAEGAVLTAVEAVLLGREAMGEGARSALLLDNWRIRRNGQLIHAESNRLSASEMERDALSLLDGQNAFATLVHIAANAEDRLAAIRASVPPNARAAISAIGERLIVRALAPSGLALRRVITPILTELGGGAHLPRLWTI
jgi:urease accessory protein